MNSVAFRSWAAESELVKKKDNFGRWLARLRTQAGLSQPELARRMGERLGRKFNHPNLAYWELGGKMANADVLPAMASALGVTIDELLKVQHTAKGYVPLPDDALPPKRF